MAKFVIDLNQPAIKSADAPSSAVSPAPIAPVEPPKLKKKFRLGAIKYYLIFSLVVLLAVNVWTFYQYYYTQRTASQALTKVVQNSFKVVDTLWQPELPNENGYTAALVMGIDTRNISFDGTEFKGKTRNIDTIIQIVYDHQTDNIFMISIPRDMGVSVTDECARQNPGKRSIHFLYDLGQKGGCEGGGVGLMKKYVTDITGFENQYFAIVSLDAFTEIVDAIGDTDEKGRKGLYMDIPEDTYELYPIDKGGYESVFFPKGHHFFTSLEVLKYARSRQYSSDFDRARRQQEVIQTVKDKVLSTDTLLDPVTLYEIYNSFKSNALFSEVGINDIKAGLSLASVVDSKKIIHIVLDDTLGGKNQLLSRPWYSGGVHRRSGYYLTPVDYEQYEDDFKLVREYMQGSIKYPHVYRETAKIFVYASDLQGGKVNLDTDAYLKLREENLPLSINESKYTQKLTDTSVAIEIIDYSRGAKSETIKLLEEKLGVKAIVPEGNKTGLNKEEITIIVNTKK